MSDAWMPFASALAGATVGGAATAVGSIAVKRREVAYEARATLHLQLLPDFEPSRSRGGWPMSEAPSGPVASHVLESRRGSAVLARRKDRRLVAKVQAAWDALDVATDRESDRRQAKWASQTGERSPEPLHVEAEEAALQSALAALGRHLERRLR